MAHRIKNRFVAPKWMGFYISLINSHKGYHSERTFSLIIFRIDL